MKKTTLKEKALNFYCKYYNIETIEGEHEKYFKDFFKDWLKLRNMFKQKKPCLWLICLRYTRGQTNNTSKRKAIITNYNLQYIINMISWKNNHWYFKTGGIWTSHALIIFDKICHNLGFNWCCDRETSQNIYIEE